MSLFAPFPRWAKLPGMTMIASLLPLSLAILGCMAEENPQPVPAHPEPAPVPAPAAAPTVAPTGGLKALRDGPGILKVAADPDAAPFMSKTPAGYEGFEYAIAQSIADGAGLKLEIVPGSFSELSDLVVSGKADLAIGQMSPSASYDGLDFSVSYLQYSHCLIVTKDSKIKGMADLAGKKVGMYDDPVARQLATVLIGSSYEPVLFEDYGYFEKLVRNQLDAMLYDCPLARHELKTYGDALRVANDALNVTTYNVAVRRGDIQLAKDVNQALKGLGEQGLLSTLKERWLGEQRAQASMETASGKVITVGAGETLSIIAQRELGSVDAWQKLYDANKDVVGPDADLVYAGMTLRVPKG
jgi:ABC-type amino acid transport substrate-binding protein